MINPDEKVEYNLFLKNVEHTISGSLKTNVNIFGDPKLPNMKNPNLTLVQQNMIPAAPVYRKLKFTIVSVHSQYLEQ